MPKIAGPFLQNTYPISQRFGANPARYSYFGLAGHDGIDIEVPVETTVLAGVTGVVLGVGEDPPGYGKYVKVYDYNQNLLIVYAHLNSIAPLIKSGYKTVPQNPIGGSGNTGNSDFPHLHLGFADTDSAGNKINRENGYDGWKNPQDTSWLTLKLFGAGTPTTTTPSPTGTTPTITTPAYTGPTPPPYGPSFAGQTVSHLGNNFRSDNGSTWIFQGSDADRAAAEAAEKKRTLAEQQAKAVDAGVYLQKENLSMRFTNEGVYQGSEIIQGDAYLVITGPYEARVSEGFEFQKPWLEWYTVPGRYPTPARIERLEVRKKPLPPAPAPLPEIAVPTTQPSTTPPPAPPAGTPGIIIPPGTEPWAGKKAPTHKDIYNKLVEMYKTITNFFTVV